jgi:hypothetical protein
MEGGERKEQKEKEEQITNRIVASTEDHDKWGVMFRRLRAYKQQFGHTQIPYRFPPDPQLGRWGTFLVVRLVCYVCIAFDCETAGLILPPPDLRDQCPFNAPCTSESPKERPHRVPP